MRAWAGRTPHWSRPSSEAPSHSSPAHSATTGIPAPARSLTSCRSVVLLASWSMYTWGKPPPTTRASVPSGSRSAVSGSKVTTSAPAAARSSSCSA